MTKVQSGSFWLRKRVLVTNCGTFQGGKRLARSHEDGREGGPSGLSLHVGGSLSCLGFPVAQLVKRPPALQETQVLSLGQEDPLKKGMAIHSSILAWRIPRTEEPGGLQSMGSQRVRAD